MQRGLTRPDIPIKAIGVWDTVGSLGVPSLKLFGFSLHTDTTVEYSFVNTELAPNVENAYQALALDEVRSAFTPTIWEKPGPNQVLKNTWFPVSCQSHNKLTDRTCSPYRLPNSEVSVRSALLLSSGV